MNEYLIRKLREGRLCKNLKQSDVTKITGIKNTTLSNYENGVTEPDIDTFLQLCEIYGLDYAEILGEAYGLSVPGASIDIKPSEIEIIKKYRDLDDHGREMVNFTLDKEYERSIALKNNKVVTFPHLNAAHEDNPTPEEVLNANRIMEDDSEWE